MPRIVQRPTAQLQRSPKQKTKPLPGLAKYRRKTSSWSLLGSQFDVVSAPRRNFSSEPKWIALLRLGCGQLLGIGYSAAFCNCVNRVRCNVTQRFCVSVGPVNLYRLHHFGLAEPEMKPQVVL